MRIDKNGGDAEALERLRAEVARGHAAAQPRSSAPEAAGDQVALSPGASLAGAAIKAVEAAPDIRPDVVARARALLEAGEVGADPHRLADALIDRTLRHE